MKPVKSARPWRLREPLSSDTYDALNVFPELIRPLLHTRGITDESSARLFLEPNYDRDLHDPFLLQDMARAVERIKTALKDEEKIIIFGDYDADGIPGTAILATFFDRVGYSHYEAYIPDRQTEAYGLNPEAIKNFAKAGATLIITVDCGVSNHREIALANSLGIDVIVTDHHTAPEMLPPAYAIINPKRLDDQYPYKMLCGAGVAFKLVQALAAPIAIGWEKWLLDLVAIATVADMVPLTGENRALVHFGLIVLRKSPRPGILALCRALKLNQAMITAEDIAFLIGPRLNAASRMAHGSQSYRLLTTTDPAEAEMLASVLEGNNQARRALVGSVLETAEALIDERESESGVIVCGDPSWPLGVLGLAASRLTERYNRTVFLWGQNGNGEIKGSCRGSGGVNVVSLMRLAGGDNFFINFGGHANAGGFSLLKDRLEELEERLNVAYRELETKTVVDELILDAELSLDGVTTDTSRLIDRLGPFGLDNSKPIFLFRAIPSVSARSFGADRNHLELTLTNGAVSRRAIGFFMTPAHFGATLGSDQPIDLAASLEQSYFRGRPELRLRIVDCRLAEERYPPT